MVFSPSNASAGGRGAPTGGSRIPAPGEPPVNRISSAGPHARTPETEAKAVAKENKAYDIAYKAFHGDPPIDFPRGPKYA